MMSRFRLYWQGKTSDMYVTQDGREWSYKPETHGIFDKLILDVLYSTVIHSSWHDVLVKEEIKS